MLRPSTLPDLIASRYRPVRLIATGGMGAVYEVEHVRTGEHLALKVLRTDGAASLEALDRFKIEARAFARIKSDHVVRVVDADVSPELEGAPFLVMELLDGTDLEQAASAARPEPAIVISWLRQVAFAVDKAHRLGLVHRDLKPENLFLAKTADGRSTIKILDFGIAKVIEDGVGATRSGQIVGTPEYMAPEQASSKGQVTPATDLFALGLVAYRLIAGERYYQGDVMSILAQLLYEPLTPPSRRHPTLGAAFDAWFAKACDRDPQRRFGSASEQIEALAAALGLPAWSREEQTRAPAPGKRRDRAMVAFGSRSGRAGFRRLLVGIGALAVMAIAMMVIARSRRSAGDDQGPRSRDRSLSSSLAGGPLGSKGPLPPPGSPFVLACPPFRVRGGEEPSGWLGAAAAATFCERARILLGGRPERTLIPAELLDLPASLTGAFPSDPFDAPDSRERALAAARRATAYVDGEIRDLGTEFEVTLSIRTSDGRQLGSGRGGSPALYAAVRQAMEPLRSSGALPRVPLDPDIARWALTTDPDILLALADVRLAQYQSAGTFDDECARVSRIDAAPAAQREYWRWRCAEARGRSGAELRAPRPSATDPVRFAHEAWLFHTANDGHDQRPIALTLQELGRHESSAWGRSVLAGVEACLWQGIDMDAARAAALRAVEQAPKNPDLENCSPWPMLTTVIDGFDASSTFRAAAGWNPWLPVLSIFASNGDAAADLRGAVRAYRLAPEHAWVAARLFDVLLKAGDRERARAIALRLRAGDVPVLHLQSDILLVRLDASEARFAAALARAEEALGHPPRAGYAQYQTMELAWRAVEIGEVLGRGTEVADQVARTILLSEPTAIGPNDDLLQAAPLCAASSRTVAGECLKRLRDLLDRGYFRSLTADSGAVVQAAEHYARGELRQAAAVLRPMLARQRPSQPALGWLMISVFDRSGAPTLADRIDEPATAAFGEFNGVDLAYVRAARRHSRDDPSRAGRLARKVIGAWETADQPPPVLGEMRALARH